MVSSQRSEPVVRLIDPEADLAAVVRADSRAFGSTVDVDATLARVGHYLEFDRFWVADDDGDIAGHLGVFSFDLTLPGRVAHPVAGVTWVGVAPTHRRLGLMRRMMEASISDARHRGECVAALYASEAGIYGNVGFGPASINRDIEIDPRRVRWLPELPSPGGRCRWIDDPDEVSALVRPIYDQWRLSQPGQISRNDGFWFRNLVDWPLERSDKSAVWTLFHFDGAGTADGYARYRLRDNWQGMNAKFRLFVEEVVHTTPDAHASLWATLLATDLVETVEMSQFALDDPLGALLVDSRAITTTSYADGMWIRVLDVEVALAARRYEVDGSIVLEVTGAGSMATDPAIGRYRLTVTGGVGECRRESDSTAEVTLGLGELGSLLLGGGDASRLAAVGRVAESTAGAVVRLDRLMRSHPLPNCTTGF